jgi:hypothetical protein
LIDRDLISSLYLHFNLSNLVHLLDTSLKNLISPVSILPPFHSLIQYKIKPNFLMMVKQEERVQYAACTGKENTYQNIEVKTRRTLVRSAQAEG